MRTTWLGLMVMGIGIGVVGCGHDSHPGDMGGDMSVVDDMAMPDDMVIPNDAQKLVTFTMFATDYAKALCGHFQTCGMLDAAQLDACITRNTLHLGWDEDVEIMKGRVSLNELQCLDAIKNARCDFSDSLAWGFRCIDFLNVPHVANGGSCLSGIECESGFCKHGGSDAGAAGVMQVTGCPGTCAPVLGLGELCRLDTDCAADAYCDKLGTKTCTKAPNLNEVCDGFCKLGLLCPTYPTTMPAVCVTPVTQTALDGDCDPNQGAVTASPPCPASMYCQVQYDGTMMPTGGKCKMKIASGMPCDPKNEGPVFGGVGAFSFAENQCADGSSCYSTTGVAGSETCHALGSLNDDCNAIFGTSSTCKQGLWCDTSTTPGKCAAFLSDGTTCPGGNKQCSSFLPGQSTCIDDVTAGGADRTCQVAKNFGASCKPVIEDSLCAASDNAGSSFCLPLGGGAGSCAPKCF